MISFDVLSGHVVCLSLEGPAHLLGTALLLGQVWYATSISAHRVKLPGTNLDLLGQV